MVAAARPSIVLINDLHWAEKTFLDLLVSALETAHAPIVFVGSARHDLLEVGLPLREPRNPNGQPAGRAVGLYWGLSREARVAQAGAHCGERRSAA